MSKGLYDGIEIGQIVVITPQGFSTGRLKQLSGKLASVVARCEKNRWVIHLKDENTDLLVWRDEIAEAID